MPINWLRILGTAELPQIDQRVRQPFHPIVPLRHALKPQEASLAFGLPRQGPLAPGASRLEGFLAQPRAPALGPLAVAGMFLEGGEHAGMEQALPMVRGIKAAVEGEGGAAHVAPDRLGSLLQGLQARRKEPHRRVMDGSHGAGSADRTMVVRDRADLLALRVFVPCIPPALPPFWATGWVPSPGRRRRARGFAVARGATLAPTACPSDPASAHLAKTLSPGVAWLAGGPWMAVGTGQPCHGIPR